MEAEYIIYQPLPNKQMLLYDLATSSSVLTYLKMEGIAASIRSWPNSEFMSENGRLPVVIEKGKDRPMCGFSDVYRHVSQTRNFEPSLLELSYMSWVETEFLAAEMYLCWCINKTIEDYTYPRSTYDLPWPVSEILFRQKRSQIQSDIGSKYEDFEDFLASFKRFLEQLNKRIGSKTFCLSDTKPSCVDALIYGHINAIKSTSLNARVTNAIDEERRIIKLVDLIDKNYPS